MWSLVDDKLLNSLLRVLTGLAGLALGIFAAALAGYLLQPDQRIGVAVATLPRIERPKSLTDYQIILDRNLFNPDGPKLQFNSATGAKTAAPPKPAPAIDWKLVGTVSGGKTPLATLRGQGKTRVWHLGDKLSDGSRLIRIDRTSVRLRLADGRETTLSLPKGQTSSATRTGKSQSKVSQRTQRTTPAIGGGIRQLNDTSWHIPRLEAERARNNIGTLLRQARVEPNLVDGKTEGFVIRMIQPGT
ncbi:MAG: hypothetical protein D6794_00995, partial [Deltaproteobacteria bacterium]